MSQTERHRRLRLLLHKLNRQRKQQARQIDILCNDLISAQRAFIERLSTVSFAAQFYRALLASTDLRHLLSRVDRLIRQELPGVGTAFYLRHSEGCGLYPFEGGELFAGEQSGPQEHLTAELVDNICKSNKTRILCETSGPGPEVDMPGLAGFSIAALPLSDLGRPLGFLLLWRRSPQVVTADEIRRIEAVLCGLSQAVRAARVSQTCGE
jgi:hypothetical protein